MVNTYRQVKFRIGAYIAAHIKQALVWAALAPVIVLILGDIFLANRPIYIANLFWLSIGGLWFLGRCFFLYII